jgi:hypothetical protein
MLNKGDKREREDEDENMIARTITISFFLSFFLSLFAPLTES